MRFLFFFQFREIGLKLYSLLNASLIAVRAERRAHWYAMLIHSKDQDPCEYWFCSKDQPVHRFRTRIRRAHSGPLG